MEKRKIILKSMHPSDYPDLIVECKVIPNDKIREYLSTISDENKFYAHKSSKVKARRGVPGEKIKTTLKTVIDGREYILNEEENVVKEHKHTTEKGEEGLAYPDVVVTNYNSTSNEEYVVKHQKFIETYDIVIEDPKTFDVSYVPKYDSRLLTRVDENVIIMTLWGEPAVCLAGSYIVTYNEKINDYNTLEKGAFDSTYETEKEKNRSKKIQ